MANPSSRPDADIAAAPARQALARLSKRLATAPRTDWAPPPLPLLIERIDAALAQRAG